MLDDHKIGTNVKLRCREYHRESKHIDRITSYRLLNETMSRPEPRNPLRFDIVEDCSHLTAGAALSHSLRKLRCQRSL